MTLAGTPIFDLELTPTRRREIAAVRRARQLGGPGLVRRLALGSYVVPSATAAGVEYLVTGSGPLLDGYRCSCTASQHGNVCWHVASVHLRRLAENALRDARRLPGVSSQLDAPTRGTTAPNAAA